MICLGVLTGCGALPGVGLFSRAVPEEPLPFRAQISTTRGSPAFTVTTVTNGAPLSQWRESARYQGTRFCMRRYGSSEITWDTSGGPDDWVVRPLDARTALVRGRCDPR
ncbi:hypothetical protein ILP92_12300 [Maribius pontilimi]|uniref:Uncharacterized protein n=1 Tax=Palleronia pontilimi TaxID=1964209 RepID=A0A934IIH0_9RHOB|nr:hypothetical protein [Palleronia pontilimi]MBJ3763528.1 hypothetical protein [Palleronia pontilimi]